ncbi:hypothetical protein HY485_04725 [Candidatus Woesearchaeota archaeon]|nr:hypothetical protein [Candidatus Woesearchaeota archaeon]
MQLVVDTNILVSFFRENPVRFAIINSKMAGLELFTPEYAIDELKANKSDLLKYSKLKNEKELELVIAALRTFVEIKQISFFKEFKPQSIKISPDAKDAPFFALALKLKSSIWSNEPRLKRQSAVKVFNTRELLTLLKLV